MYEPTYSNYSQAIIHMQRHTQAQLYYTRRIFRLDTVTSSRDVDYTVHTAKCIRKQRHYRNTVVGLAGIIT